jgi:hypothetical protein
MFSNHFIRTSRANNDWLFSGYLHINCTLHGRFTGGQLPPDLTSGHLRPREKANHHDCKPGKGIENIEYPLGFSRLS